MKKLFIIISFIAYFSSSCQKQLELSPISSISANSFWKTENDARGAMFGLYNCMRSALGNYNYLFWGEFRNGYWESGSAGAITEWVNIWDNNLDPITAGTNWSGLYQVINDANLILKYVPNIPFTNEQERAEILGHAYFMRAFSYFYVVRIWGDAPISTTPFESADQDLYLSRRPVTEIYQLLKADIDKAGDMLPSASANFLANKSTANILKADIYVWLAKIGGGGEAELQVANQALNNVLSAEYQFSDSYLDVFRNNDNKEIIFSIFYNEIEGGTNYSDTFIPTTTDVPATLRDIVPYKPSPNRARFNQEFVTQTLNQAPGDSRTAVIWQEIPLANGLALKWINKYIGKDVAGVRMLVDNVRIYRLADVILFKAEVENALHHPTEAINWINKIARRAYGQDNYYPTSLNEDQVNTAILKERMIEFAAEGKTWFDIVRFGKAFTLIPSLQGRENEHEGHILYFPVAQDVISRNVNIKQTKGY
ncbi:RagB/SusD family nutrient uptake outer membrane protein [Sphingobacterium arenae]|uniref:RagB/SusD family nutrient uptake outer membrane protein n=1 Tax=Sphingobacterium arenae TaxID=1280598 RepID=A0ABR7XYR1_9SPHI|nr:RagB/SusD family nutrient uptake outer membrane protein [Sphingobacterium arenae]MBD1424167.1 RagB/SusD family nutrient uptake outer membrane protein [Sphingobacterium arenae]